MIPAIDFETYSEAGYVWDDTAGRFLSLMGKGKKAGLPIINAPVYAEHPRTRLISLAYNLSDGCGTRLWIPTDGVPHPLFNYIHTGAPLEAHNSAFEFYIWWFVCSGRMGWPDVPLEQWRCSAAKGRAWGLPGKLEMMGAALNSDETKDPRGKQLIRLLSVPKIPGKADPMWYRTTERYPDLYKEMYDYNIQDVKTEQSIGGMCPSLSESELAVWMLDQRINARGVQIDRKGLDACLYLYQQAERRYTDELIDVTHGKVRGVGEITKNSAGDKWLQEQGVLTSSLDKDHVEMLLCNPKTPPIVRRVLEIRQLIGGASVKKLFALQRHLSSDGRIRDLFTYCGAERTGRWAGRGPQPQNLKSGGPALNGREWCYDLAEEALADIHTGDLDGVEDKWGSAVELIGSCLRLLFVAADGCDLISSDYSAIEAVVAAAIAGEQWRLDVFNTHGKIYEASASKAFGVPLDEILEHKVRTGEHHPLRKKGKVCELAGGYGGWVRAWRAFGATGSNDEIKADVLRWRDDSPNIVEAWGGQWRKTPGRWHFTPELYGIEGCVVAAIGSPDTYHSYQGIGFGVNSREDVLYIRLPSGRDLAYHKPRLNRGTDPRGLDVWQISYMGVDSYTKKWGRIYSYGPKFFENIVQATSRDILACAMLRLETNGYPTVLHVHDEATAEVPHGFGSVEGYEAIMMQREPWFANWPIRAAGGWRGLRFRK